MNWNSGVRKRRPGAWRRAHSTYGRGKTQPGVGMRSWRLANKPDSLIPSSFYLLQEGAAEILRLPLVAHRAGQQQPDTAARRANQDAPLTPIPGLTELLIIL